MTTSRVSIVVHVRYFAGAAAAAGVTEESVELSGPVTVAGLHDELVSRRPALASVLGVATLLLDEVAVRDLSATVPDGASLDVLPPFAGG
jgi:molybdopterin converting factor small subunit